MTVHTTRNIDNFQVHKLDKLEDNYMKHMNQGIYSIDDR